MASAAVIEREDIRQEATTVALRETPALQCTSTLCFLRFSVMNLPAESKKHLMFSLGSSAIRMRRCFRSFPTRSSASPITVRTAPMPNFWSSCSEEAKLRLPSASPYIFCEESGCMIQSQELSWVCRCRDSSEGSGCSLLAYIQYGGWWFIIVHTQLRMRVGVVLLLAVVGCVVGRGTTFEELQEKLGSVVGSPFVNLMFVFDSSAKNGELMRQGVQEIARRKEGFFRVVMIDCDTDDEKVIKGFPYCGADIRSKLPALNYLEPVLNPVDPETGEKKEPRNVQYQGQLQEKALYEFAVPLMKLYSVAVRNAGDWQKLQSSYPGTPKVLYFTDKDRISPFFKALTAHFRETIVFGHVFKNSSLCAQLGVTTFPTLLLNGKTQLTSTSNLLEQIDILKVHEGEATNIVIAETVAVSELTAEQLQERIFQKARHILVHVAAADGKPHPEWKRCQESFRGMFDYLEGSDVAAELGIAAKHRPSIIYFPKSLAQKTVRKTVFHSGDSFRVIYDEIAGLIEDFSVPLSSDMQMQRMTSLALEEGRLLAVLFHKQDISLSYRVLSNDDRFKESLAFFRYKDPDAQMLAKFQLKKLPALIVMVKDESNTTEPTPEEIEQGRRAMNLQIAQYTGKYNYDDLEKYLNMFVEKPKAPEPEPETTEVKEIKSQRGLQRLCGEEGCYLLLLDGSPQQEAANKEHIDSIRRINGKVVGGVSYIDAKCHSEVASAFEIYSDDLPALVFVSTKTERYTRLVGRIQPSSVESFAGKVRSGRVSWRGFAALEMASKNCEEEHKRLLESEQAGSQMSEEEARILEEVRLEEEKKKQEAAGDEKEGKKKRRKRRPRQQESEL